MEYLDSGTGTWIDSSGEDWVSSFDTSTGELQVDYSTADYYATYSVNEVEFNLKVTLTDPRSLDPKNTIEDTFTIVFSDICDTDTLTLGWSLSNLGDIPYIIDSGPSNAIAVEFTQLV